jgi:hypothetical protein
MRPRDLVMLLAGGVMMLLIAGYAVRVASMHELPRLELGRVKVMQLEPAAREALASLRHDVLITYYVSASRHMPSSMRRLERDVTDLLGVMKRAAAGRLDYQIIDPESQPDAVRHAAHQRIAPFRVRSIARDSYSEKTVWSSLHIAYGGHEPAAINGVSPEHVPRLQQLIIGQIAQKDRPRPPRIALSAGSAYESLQSALGRYGEVQRIDLNRGDAIPPETDLLLWMDPARADPALMRGLSRFLSGGGSALVAGATHSVEVEHGPPPIATFSRTAYDPQPLLSAFGLRAAEVLVLDEFSQHVAAEPAPMPAKFLVRCIAPNQDFRTMRDLPNGHLLFAAPTPLMMDGDSIAAAGMSATVLATTSDRTTIAQTLEGRVRLDSSALQHGEAAPKLPLMVWLRPIEQWRGSIVFSSASTPFRDGAFLADGFAHRRLLEVLCRTLASDERLVIRDAGIERAEPLPELSGPSRAMWRAFVMLLVPAALAVIALRRGAFRSSRDGPSERSLSLAAGVPLQAAAGLVLVGVVVSIVGAVGVRADLTRGRVNELTEAARRIAQDATRTAPVEAALIFSAREQLPPEMRPAVKGLRETLRELRRAGADIAITALDTTDAEVRSQLEARGIAPIRFISRDEETTTVRTVYCTLELTRGDGSGRRETLHFPDRASFENLEFRLAFAMWRLHTGRRPHIAFASDVPRLSAAEAFHDFQQRNLLAPTGTDVYSDARESLEHAGFRITHVDPRAPEIPEDADLIVWMQPRRNILPMLDALVDRLHAGVPAVIAAQHFNMQARQYRGAGFEMVYWPQPQVADIHRTYLPDLGIELVHEVLFDEMKFAMPLETQVNLAAGERAYEQQASALPFLIRAVAANFARDHSVTRGLGDQAMPFAAYVRLDGDRLTEHGLRATPLLTTSRRTWTFDWSGGWLPRDLLSGPPLDADGRPQWRGRLPLAVLVEGAFPKPAEPLTIRRTEDSGPVSMDPGEGAEASLLLIGCSEMFKNARLRDVEFRADHLLLNAAATLALGDDLGSIAAHRRIPPGFDVIDPEQRMLWRAIVLGGGPAILLLFGASWLAVRSRPSRARVPEARS